MLLVLRVYNTPKLYMYPCCITIMLLLGIKSVPHVITYAFSFMRAFALLCPPAQGSRWPERLSRPQDSTILC